MQKVNRGSTFKRLGAAMMDFFLSIILAMFLVNIVGTNIANAAFGLNDKSIEVRDDLFDAGLYVYGKLDSSTNKYNIVLDFEATEEERTIVFNDKEGSYAYLQLNNSSLNITSERYDKCLTHFYEEINKLDEYKDLQNNSELFQTESKDETKLRSFYDNVYDKVATLEYLKLYNDGKTYDLNQYINLISAIITLISLILSFGVFYLLIPLLSKKRATLGKMMMSLALVNKSTGYIASRVAILIRFLTFLVIELLLSLYLYGLPLLVSIILIFALKGSAIHDLTARTMVADTLEQKLYRNEEEMKRDLGLTSDVMKEEDIIEVEATPINKDVDNEVVVNDENKKENVIEVEATPINKEENNDAVVDSENKEDQVTNDDK